MVPQHHGQRPSARARAAHSGATGSAMNSEANENSSRHAAGPVRIASNWKSPCPRRRRLNGRRAASVDPAHRRRRDCGRSQRPLRPARPRRQPYEAASRRHTPPNAPARRQSREARPSCRAPGRTSRADVGQHDQGRAGSLAGQPHDPMTAIARRLVRRGPVRPSKVAIGANRAHPARPGAPMGADRAGRGRVGAPPVQDLLPGVAGAGSTITEPNAIPNPRHHSLHPDSALRQFDT